MACTLGVAKWSVYTDYLLKMTALLALLTLVPRVLALSQVNNAARNPYADLSSWVRRAGGRVHPALELRDPAPCGARGLVATSHISADEAERAPLARRQCRIQSSRFETFRR